ncbi:MAG: hypothetical protein RMJ82_07775, partial [Gemmatales bacterium]|nr:hypothetical protein [Gemmatales bacterium]
LAKVFARSIGTGRSPRARGRPFAIERKEKRLILPLAIARDLRDPAALEYAVKKEFGITTKVRIDSLSWYVSDRSAVVRLIDHDEDGKNKFSFYVRNDASASRGVVIIIF